MFLSSKFTSILTLRATCKELASFPWKPFYLPFWGTVALFGHSNQFLTREEMGNSCNFIIYRKDCDKQHINICLWKYVKLTDHSLLTRTFLPLQDFTKPDTIKLIYPLFFCGACTSTSRKNATIRKYGFLFGNVPQKKEGL